MMIFISMIVLTNIIGVKIFEFSPFFLDKNITLKTGIITYPLTFLITDFVCEVFGKKRACQMVFYGFIACILSLLFINIAVVLLSSIVWITNSLGYSAGDQLQHAYN